MDSIGIGETVKLAETVLFSITNNYEGAGADQDLLYNEVETLRHILASIQNLANAHDDLDFTSIGFRNLSSYIREHCYPDLFSIHLNVTEGQKSKKKLEIFASEYVDRTKRHGLKIRAIALRAAILEGHDQMV